MEYSAFTSGYKRLDFDYVHPSWGNKGFLTTYYSVLSNKPEEQLQMIEELKSKEAIYLLPL